MYYKIIYLLHTVMFFILYKWETSTMVNSLRYALSRSSTFNSKYMHKLYHKFVHEMQSLNQESTETPIEAITCILKTIKELPNNKNWYFSY